MKKLLFIIESIEIGGTQKNLKILLEYLSNEKFKIELLVFRRSIKEIEVPKSIKITSINLNKESKNFYQKIVNNYLRIMNIRDNLKSFDPDLTISFLTTTNIVCLIANTFLRSKLLICERNDPYKQSLNRIWLFLRMLFLRKNIKILCNSLSAVKYYKRKGLNSQYIRNFIQIPKKESGKITIENFILAVGRLHEQKNYEKLLFIFSKVLKSYPSLNLVILGRGCKKKIKEKILEIKIQDNVHLLGHKAPYLYYKKALFYISVSKYEGVANSVLEAMCMGKAVVINEELKYNLNEYIEDKVNGYFVKIEEFDHMITYLMRNKLEREKIGKNAAKTIRRFSNERIYYEWLKVFRFEL